jgi:hypothetical protein
MCIANMDIVLAVDGSGSVKESGFEILKNFTGELLKRFLPDAHGVTAMKVGIILFGNGEILDDGSIQPAEEIMELRGGSEGFKAAKEKVAGMKHARGFTNMAQAIAKAGQMSQIGGRLGAGTQLLLITDGGMSFKFETKAEAKKWKDYGYHLNAVVIRQNEDDDWVADMKNDIVTQPWRTHFSFIAGLQELNQNVEGYTDQVLVQNCPLAESATQRALEAKAHGYELVMTDHDCQDWWRWLGNFPSGEACAAEAMDPSDGEGPAYFFVWGKGPLDYHGGDCYANENLDESATGACLGGLSDSTFDLYALTGKSFPMGEKILEAIERGVDAEEKFFKEVPGWEPADISLVHKNQSRRRPKGMNGKGKPTHGKNKVFLARDV